MARKKILFICGSPNQTWMMLKISAFLKQDYDCYFTPFYCDGILRFYQWLGWLDFTIIGGQNRRNTETLLNSQHIHYDYAGRAYEYDLILTCTDLVVQKNLKGKKVILIQEGMTDPENFMFRIVKHVHRFGVPRWLASTSTTGLSDCYVKFCVASDGYKDHFVNKGVKASKVVVTGIPNYDNVQEYLQNDFPHKDYVLVATTDTRENMKWDNRKKFILDAVKIANGKQLIFKLHPNENVARSTSEINRWAPGALVYPKGNTNHMVANCHTLVTQYSTVVYIGLALGKEVHSYFKLEELKRLVPWQNGGGSAQNIAEVCKEYL